MNELMRILIVDDHMVVRRGLRSLLTPRNGMVVVGEAADGVEAVALAGQLNPDLILMDMLMPRKDGVTATLEILQQNPQARILVLTSFGEDEQVMRAIRAGARGYLLKDSSPDQLFEAIRTVVDGRLLLPPETTARLLDDFHSPAPPPSPRPDLTLREQDVLKCIARGQSNQQIAAELNISVSTVSTHVRNLLKKLDMSNRTQIALYAREHDLV
ncbi:MAG: response regulator transcription factor [Anaerolineae bacterium]